MSLASIDKGSSINVDMVVNTESSILLCEEVPTLNLSLEFFHLILNSILTMLALVAKGSLAVCATFITKGVTLADSPVVYSLGTDL